MRRSLTGPAFTLPALLGIGLTMIFPMLQTLWFSVNSNKTVLKGTPDFVGLKNYGRMSANPDFINALWHTLGFVFVTFILEAVISLAVAMALHRGLKGTPIFRAIVALPLMVAPVVGALAWRFIFVDNYGLIDSMAGYLGGAGPLWFSDIWLARITIVVANLWMALPFDILVLVAGLASLPTDPLEAAKVDGAGPWTTFTQIILPMLRPIFAIIIIVRLADAFRIFDVVYVLTGGGPANGTEVLSTFTYKQMFTAFDFAGGAAAVVMLVLVTTALSLTAFFLLRDRRGTR